MGEITSSCLLNSFTLDQGECPSGNFINLVLMRKVVEMIVLYFSEQKQIVFDRRGCFSISLSQHNSAVPEASLSSAEVKLITPKAGFSRTIEKFLNSKWVSIRLEFLDNFCSVYESFRHFMACKIFRDGNRFIFLDDSILMETTEHPQNQCIYVNWEYLKYFFC